jgi:4-alpha-glucanotransferase
MADHQLADAAGRGRICVDLPVGVHPHGFDPSWQPGAFVTGASGGAPPDAFAAGGQDWGIRPLHPEGVREQGYGYVITMLRTAMRHAGVVRIDHIMGLHRIYLVPEGGDARHGAYVRYRSEELHAIVVLEATRAGVAVVGEDLGTVPPEVRPAMRRSGMLRSFVWQFEGTPEDPLPPPPVDAVASLGTHDLATFVSFWDGDDIAERRSGGRTDEESAQVERRRRRALTESASRALEPATRQTLPAAAAFAGCAEHLARGAATLVQLDTADLWGEREPQNRPGTTVDQGSFRLRYPRTLACLAHDHDAVAVLRRVDGARGRPGP